jgi:uncharacterized membrane protein YciS (DUF1049 family)
LDFIKVEKYKHKINTLPSIGFSHNLVATWVLTIIFFNLQNEINAIYKSLKKLNHALVGPPIIIGKLEV